MGACFQKVELMKAVYVHMCLSGTPANFTAHVSLLIRLQKTMTPSNTPFHINNLQVDTGFLKAGTPA